MTGVVTEEIIAYCEDRMGTAPQDLLRQLEGGLRHCAANGVTTIDFVNCDLMSFRALQILRGEGKLLARVRVHLNPGALEALRALGVRGGYGDDWLKIVGIKIIADGSLGARTAWLSFPYDDSLGNYGTACMDEKGMRDIAGLAEEMGLQLASHGIGDRAIDLILGVYGRLGGIGRLRHRIDHCSIVRSDQMARMKELGIAVAIQPHFVITDWWVTKRTGESRADLIYAFKALIDNGIRVGISTDCPVEPLNPWETIYAAITRGENEAIPLAKYTPGQKLTLEEALDGYTRGSAHVMNEGNDLGTLEPGRYADFVVLQTDPFSVGPEQIACLKALETYVGGRKIRSLA